MTSDADVILLFGGPSRERLVSVASAQNVAPLLGSPRCWFWAATGALHELGVRELTAHERPFERELAPRDPARWPDIKHALASCSGRETFFLALHGGVGEDGTLQGWLEERRLAFTGSGSRASRDAFDKARAREIVAASGVRVAEAALVQGCDPARARERLAGLLERFAKLVLKPVADGSSMGLRILEGPAELADALAALEKDGDRPYLAEAFVTGTELTVGVIDDAAGLRALPCSEVRVERGRSFGYTEKYLGTGAREITPAEVPDAVARAAQELAVTAHRALGCAGYTRTDLIVDAQGPVYLETNTLPGLTRASFIPQQLAAAGVPFERFVRRQLELARRRAGR